jgi:glycosyltransferase involved in cell wall biosynthesis
MINILTFVGSYLPGYKAGGPIRTIVNMADSLAGYYLFKIITLDRDLGDKESYSDIKINDWNEVGRALVYYSEPTNHTFYNIIKLIKKTPHDLIYLNSFFSWGFTIKPLLLKKIGLIPKKTPIVLAPRGEFSAGALNLKSFKKKTYISIAKILGIYNNLVWQASSEFEKDNIIRVMGNYNDIFIAPDLPAPSKLDSLPIMLNSKEPGSIRCIFLARISPMKNLKGALETLNAVKGQVEFNIYGPIEDIDYWNECQTIIYVLPENITVKYKGMLDHEQVAQVFSEHHLFLFPTLGENFGHVIIESLVAGCPVLISDQTPWKNLDQEKVGWDLPLDRPELFKEVLQEYIDMDNEKYKKMSQRAREYGIERSNDQKVLDANRNLFKYAIKKN